MRKSTIGRGVGLALLFGCIVAISGTARAAGEWEWTEGQGWIRGAGVARPTAKEQLHYAYELEQKSEFMDAARQYFLLVQNFPSSEEAGVGLQRLARCLFEMENYYTSFKAIEQVIETYPNTGRMSDLVAVELQIAKRLMQSQTPDLLSAPESDARNSNISRGLEIVTAVIEHDPYGPSAAEAYLVRGEGNLLIGAINAARTAFETVRDEFPRSDFYERARLGILQCDSLVGQANPQEVREQIEVVREAERERAERYRDQDVEFDDVEESIRQLSEVEAQKMMDQAEHYRRMGTRDAVKASEFLYKEVVRRYPGTEQAYEANDRLGNIRLPKEQSRVAKVVKGINLNPFSYGKPPEPAWIVPQLNPEDMVMVDSGVGPITGVPETGLPNTDYSSSVRPAALPDQPELPPRQRNFSPMSAAPERDETAKSDATIGPVPPPGQTEQARRPAPAPLSTATDRDLIYAPGANNRAPAATQDPGYVHPYDAGGVYAGGLSAAGPQGGAPRSANQYYDNTPIIPGGATNPPSLGAAAYHTPYSDLIGPSSGQQQPLGGQYSPAPPAYQSYPAPQEPVYQNQTYPRTAAPYGGYENQNNYNAYQDPYQSGYNSYNAGNYDNGYNAGGNGGWTFGGDMR